MFSAHSFVGNFSVTDFRAKFAAKARQKTLAEKGVGVGVGVAWGGVMGFYTEVICMSNIFTLGSCERNHFLGFFFIVGAVSIDVARKTYSLFMLFKQGLLTSPCDKDGRFVVGSLNIM